MPARLNVIMIESAPAAGSARRLAEAVVGELIGLAGVDLALVQSLTGLAATSTDRLTLESITGDVCVLDWQSPETIVSSLNAIGFAGRRAPHPHDLDTSDAVASTFEPPARRIYAFQMSRFSDAKELCEALNDLRKVREVRTFSLLAPNSGTRRTSENPLAPGQSKSLSKSNGLASPAKSAEQPSRSQGVSELHHLQPKSPSRPLDGGMDLEALVNQLDDFDS